MGFAVRGHHLPPKILSEKFPLEESFLCRQHCTSQCKVRARYDRHGQARYWKALGFAVERTPPATENFAREISAGRVFPLSAALDRVYWLLSQQKKLFREGEAISLFSGMHGT